METRAAVPGFIEPAACHAQRGSAPRVKEWVHEIKFDGYRMLGIIDDGKARLVSRNGKDWTEAFQPIATMLEALPVKSAVLDGEVVVTDDEGRTNFSQLKDALSQGQYGRFQYYVFDMLTHDGKDIRKQSLRDRKVALAAVLAQQRAWPRNTLF